MKKLTKLNQDLNQIKIQEQLQTQNENTNVSQDFRAQIHELKQSRIKGISSSVTNQSQDTGSISLQQVPDLSQEMIQLEMDIQQLNSQIKIGANAILQQNEENDEKNRKKYQQEESVKQEQELNKSRDDSFDKYALKKPLAGFTSGGLLSQVMQQKFQSAADKSKPINLPTVDNKQSVDSYRSNGSKIQTSNGQETRSLVAQSLERQRSFSPNQQLRATVMSNSDFARDSTADKQNRRIDEPPREIHQINDPLPPPHPMVQNFVSKFARDHAIMQPSNVKNSVERQPFQAITKYYSVLSNEIEKQKSSEREYRDEIERKTKLNMFNKQVIADIPPIHANSNAQRSLEYSPVKFNYAHSPEKSAPFEVNKLQNLKDSNAAAVALRSLQEKNYRLEQEKIVLENLVKTYKANSESIANRQTVKIENESQIYALQNQVEKLVKQLEKQNIEHLEEIAEKDSQIAQMREQRELERQHDDEVRNLSEETRVGQLQFELNRALSDLQNERENSKFLKAQNDQLSNHMQKQLIDRQKLLNEIAKKHSTDIQLLKLENATLKQENLDLKIILHKENDQNQKLIGQHKKKRSLSKDLGVVQVQQITNEKERPLSRKNVDRQKSTVSLVSNKQTLKGEKSAPKRKPSTSGSPKRKPVPRMSSFNEYLKKSPSVLERSPSLKRGQSSIDIIKHNPMSSNEINVGSSSPGKRVHKHMSSIDLINKPPLHSSINGSSFQFQNAPQITIQNLNKEVVPVLKQNTFETFARNSRDLLEHGLLPQIDESELLPSMTLKSSSLINEKKSRIDNLKSKYTKSLPPTPPLEKADTIFDNEQEENRQTQLIEQSEQNPVATDRQVHEPAILSEKDVLRIETTKSENNLGVSSATKTIQILTDPNAYTADPEFQYQDSITKIRFSGGISRQQSQNFGILTNAQTKQEEPQAHFNELKTKKSVLSGPALEKKSPRKSLGNKVNAYSEKSNEEVQIKKKQTPVETPKNIQSRKTSKAIESDKGSNFDAKRASISLQKKKTIVKSTKALAHDQLKKAMNSTSKKPALGQSSSTQKLTKQKTITSLATQPDRKEISQSTLKAMSQLTRSVTARANPLTPKKKTISSPSAAKASDTAKIKIIKTQKKEEKLDPPKVKKSAATVVATTSKKTSKEKDKKSTSKSKKKVTKDPARELQPTATSARMFEAMSQMMDLLSNESMGHSNNHGVPKLKLSDLNNEQLRQPRKDLHAIAVAYRNAMDQDMSMSQEPVSEVEYQQQENDLIVSINTNNSRKSNYQEQIQKQKTQIYSSANKLKETLSKSNSVEGFTNLESKEATSNTKSVQQDKESPNFLKQGPQQFSPDEKPRFELEVVPLMKIEDMEN